MRASIHHGDCVEVMRGMADASVDSIVTDPPYELGFMGKGWDATGIANRVEMWCEAFRVLKPGGHLLAFSGARTYHRMVCAIEDAGFEIRDQIMWLYGSGFPKSLDVSKAIDKAAGAEREVIGLKDNKGRAPGNIACKGLNTNSEGDPITTPATPEAQQLAGWGTALKPAWEPICVARKPLIGTVAANVLAHGTGAINIDGCRVVTDDGANRARPPRTANEILGGGKGTNQTASPHNAAGRWPANVIHDGSDEVLEAFAAFGDKSSPWIGNVKGVGAKGGKVFGGGEQRATAKPEYADTGTAARFFYSAKASKADRAGSKHPTVKPISLMRYLCKLVTPPGGTVLDPFAGSGTTLQAAIEEGFGAIGIERETEYLGDILRRMEAMAPESVKTIPPQPDLFQPAA